MTNRLKLVLVVGLVVAGCGGGATEEPTIADDTGATTTTVSEMTSTTSSPAPTTTAAVTTTTAEGVQGMIPDPSTGVTLVPYVPDGEVITTGDVFVYWYRDTGGGNYLALYSGPGIAGAEGLGLCPGNSIAAPDFVNVSNTPVEEGACDGFPTDTASVQVCSGGVWIYRTAIPGDLEGTLYGSLEWRADDGAVKGLTSQMETTPDMPEFEYGLASYTLWDGFTADGSSQITCSEPMT